MSGRNPWWYFPGWVVHPVILFVGFLVVFLGLVGLVAALLLA